MCRRFDTIPGCDGQTDGRTDGIAVANTALAMRALRRAVKTIVLYLQFLIMITLCNRADHYIFILFLLSFFLLFFLA